MLEKIKALHAKPNTVLASLAVLGLLTTLLAGWGLWRMADISVDYKSRDDRMLIHSVNIKEKIASFSKLTYDFLLQQDFNRMLMKEKQSDATREQVTQNLGALSLASDADSGVIVESVRYSVMQFLTLTDKALETAVEEGSAARARSILQEEVEPALKKAQDSLSELIQARQKLGATHMHFLRQQALMFIALLVGFMALGMSLIMVLRMHLKQPGKELVVVETVKAAAPLPVIREIKKVIQAPSLSSLAFLNRFSRLHKESEDLRKLLTHMERLVADRRMEKAAVLPESDIKELTQQSEKIGMTVGRIQHINNQSRAFIDKLTELMNGMQSLATEGNMVALNVTIELAKLQSQVEGKPHDEKNAKVSEQIRALATTAATITGKMAMVLSQYRYAHEDFTKQASELMQIKDSGFLALEHIKHIMAATTQNANTLFDARAEFESYLPMINQKVGELEQEIDQLQLFANEEIESTREEPTKRGFKVIAGGAA